MSSPNVPSRRTQAERLAETRARILAATVTYIDERGFHQASLHRVAEAAGVTVGAVQHHFASKTELLTAVVESNFRQLALQMNQVNFEGASLDTRISLFVDHSWAFCSSSLYQSSLQILLGIRQEAGDDFETWLGTTLGEVMREGSALWRRVFRDIPLDDTEHLNTMLYCFSSLSGTALLARITRQQQRIDNDLRLLKQLLLLRFT